MSCDPSKTCTVCDQRGLPILPLRYAVARCGVGIGEPAPRLQAPFGKGVTGIALPADQAQYTLRLLRAGYLYVFNEVRGEWKGYVVNNDAYLLEFDIHSKVPPDMDGAEPCARMQGSAAGRCILVPSAREAGPLWIGFSDTAWTEAVWKRHQAASYRKRHMQCIDVGAWVNAGAAPASQLHMQRLEKLTDAVAEFALPAGEMEGRRVRNAYPALDYSIHPYSNERRSAVRLLEAATAAAGDFTPAMVAVNDSVGMVMDLSELIRFKVRTFEAKDDRAWKKATSDSVQVLRQAIQDSAAEQALARHRAKRYQSDEFGVPLYPAYTEEMRDRLDSMFATLPPQEEQRVREAAWGRYLDDYSESARLRFETKLSSDFDAFVDEEISRLAFPFVAWYASRLFRNVLECTHDEDDITSGRNLTTIMGACLTEVAGLRAIADAILEDLAGTYADRTNPVMRALTLNNTTAAEILDAAALPELEIANPTAWGRVFKAFAHVIDGAGKSKSKEELAAALGGVAKLAYQISGPVVLALGRAGRAAGDGVSSQAVAMATRYRMMGLLGVLSGRPLRVLQPSTTERGMAHAVVEALTDGLSGVDKVKLRKKLDAELAADITSDKSARTPTGTRNARGRKKYQWTVFWDDASRKALGAGVDPAALQDMVLSQQQLGRLVQSRTRQFVRADIGMGVASLILDGWNAYDALGKLDDEKSGTSDQRQFGLATALVAMTGSSLELVGSAMQRVRWGATRLARPFSFFANRVATRAALIAFCGRMVGAVGGFFGGALDIWKAWSAAQRGDRTTAVFFGATGLASFIVAGLMAAGILTLGVGFIVLIVLALLSLLGQWLIDMFTDNELEEWIARTPFGENGKGRFISLEEQVVAWNKIIEGAAK